MPFFEGSWFFGAFQVIFFVIFFGVLGVFIVTSIKGIGRWLNNNRQQVFSDPVRVLDKRTHVWGGSGNSRAHTSYYVTFEFENGDRQEFMVPGEMYGQTAAGDTGTLTWQGTRFHDFQRVQ